MISYHWIDATLVLNWVKIQWRRIINEKKNKKKGSIMCIIIVCK